MLLVCIRLYLYVTRMLPVCYSYVFVCNRMLLVCTRMLLVCYSYVTRMLLVVLVWSIRQDPLCEIRVVTGCLDHVSWKIKWPFQISRTIKWAFHVSRKKNLFMQTIFLTDGRISRPLFTSKAVPDTRCSQGYRGRRFWVKNDFLVSQCSLHQTVPYYIYTC